ncbi:MAG: glycosyltransferase family 2 protein, partial [Patescibacteria group bacterium]
MKTKISVSVIIASLNNAPEIKRCLDSVLKSTLPYFEIIFINDGSIDDTKEVLKEYRGNNKIKIYHFAKNKGICVSRNFGAKKSAGSILFFLDVDTEMPTDCLRIIKDFFEQKPKVGIVQPMLIYARGKKINAAGHFLTFFGFPSEIGVDDNWQKHNQIKTIFAAKGAAIGIRKNLFDKIGGFDEDYTMCVEDTDLCWRARLTGTEIVYLPETRVYHFQKRTSKKAAKEKFFYQGA